MAFESLGEGRWVSSWAPTQTAVGVTVRVTAASLQEPRIEGALEVAGSIPEGSAAPVAAAPPLSAVSFARNQPVSLGGYTSPSSRA